MIKIKQAVIVEGRYDKIKLRAILDAPIIETNGFRIFKDKEKVNLIRLLAEKRGILVLTDSDSAGFVIRNYLRGIVPAGQVTHAYIPSIAGKEKRKIRPSKEGMLGVEGIEEACILQALRNSGIVIEETIPDKKKTDGIISKTDLFELGLTGSTDSAKKRQQLLKHLTLPQYLSANAMLEYINCLFSKEELVRLIKEINL